MTVITRVTWESQQMRRNEIISRRGVVAMSFRDMGFSLFFFSLLPWGAQTKSNPISRCLRAFKVSTRHLEFSTRRQSFGKKGLLFFYFYPLFFFKVCRGNPAVNHLVHVIPLAIIFIFFKRAMCTRAIVAKQLAWTAAALMYVKRVRSESAIFWLGADGAKEPTTTTTISFQNISRLDEPFLILISRTEGSRAHRQVWIYYYRQFWH